MTDSIVLLLTFVAGIAIGGVLAWIAARTFGVIVA